MPWGFDFDDRRRDIRLVTVGLGPWSISALWRVVGSYVAAYGVVRKECLRFEGLLGLVQLGYQGVFRGFDL